MRRWGVGRESPGAEVNVRPLPRERMRLEVPFGSAAEALALANRLAAALGMVRRSLGLRSGLDRFAVAGRPGVPVAA
jgi:hypothetical protein